MGAVYLAHDPQLDRLVALKMPRALEDDPAVWRERFLSEARAAATLHHPNICPVHEVGEIDSQPYLTMAYIEGETLAARLRRSDPVSIPEAVTLVRTVSRAIAEAHERGIVHRDLKPANIMIDRRGQPIIMDFGLALRATSTDDLRLTLSGVAMGTPAYMPPEQAGGDHDAIGPPADVYALGVMLYELIGGHVPFQGKTFGKLLAQIERDPPPSLSSLNVQVDPALESVLSKCLEKEPQHRFANAASLADTLDAFLTGDRTVLDEWAARARAERPTEKFLPGQDGAPSSRQRAKPTDRRARWKPIVTGLLGFCLLALLGTIIYVQTDYGELKIELSDAQANVTVKVNGQEVILDPEGKPIRIRAGPDQLLEVSGPGFETTSTRFDLVRGGERVVRVTLTPTGAVPPGESGGAIAAEDGDSGPRPATIDPPKPVTFPAQPSLIELAGWQILTDANAAQVQAWLDERKAAKHSVLWLDSILVGDQPVFAAVAALDDRQSDWLAFTDLTEIEINDVAHPAKRVDLANYLVKSVSGYVQSNEIKSVALFHHGRNAGGAAVGVLPMTLAMTNITAGNRNGLVVRQLRPFPAGADQLRCAVYAEGEFGSKSKYGIDLDEADLTTRLTDSEREGFLPISVSGYPSEGQLQFAATFQENATKAAWEVHRNQTSAELATKSAELSASGFTPASVTAYPWDGAVRYCSVWVKEPPKPVAFPSQSTLIDQPGWQTIVDATKDEMETWLAERKAAKHSVVWLDSVLVGDKPLFSAVAALDDRRPDWIAFLDRVADDFGGKVVSKTVDTKKYHPRSMSGYTEGGIAKATLLWIDGFALFLTNPNALPLELPDLDTKVREYVCQHRVLRPYPVEGEGLFVGWMAVREKGVRSSYLHDVRAAEMVEFSQQRKTAGDWITSLAAYPKDGKLLYAAVASTNVNNVEWQTAHELTTEQFKAKNAELAAEGFRPANVTACPWDGAVRYAVVWTKDPPRPVEFPKQSTLIDQPGWQTIVDATKDEMETWLAERKAAKHSVVWLDSVLVGDKPLFSAVAALDDRQPDWIALSDVPAASFGDQSIEKLVDYNSYRLQSISGYSEHGTSKTTHLWIAGREGLMVYADASPSALGEFIDEAEKSVVVIRLIRPYPVEGGDTLMSFCAVRHLGEHSTLVHDVTAAEMTAFVEERRIAGEWCTSLTAYPKAGELKYAAVACTNLNNLEWRTSHELTVDQLKTQDAELAAQGFHPANITACPWDGAVRYCVVWVKDLAEPAKSTDP